MRKAVFAVIAALLLAGCAHGPDGTAGTAGSAVVNGDKFTKDWSIIGDNVSNGMHMFDAQYNWRLRSFIAKDGSKREHDLYVIADYWGAPRGYNVASDDTATNFMVGTLGEKVDDCRNELAGCRRQEVFTVALSEQALRAHISTGYEIQVRSKNGMSQVLVITKEQIQAQFAKVDPLLPAGAAAMPAPPPGAPHVKFGIHPIPTPPTLAQIDGLEPGHGLVIVSVDSPSPAMTAGIKMGDIILSMNGTPVNDTNAAQAILATITPGQSIPVVFRRGLNDITVTVTF